MPGEQAKGLVEEALARKYRQGDRIRVSLPPSRMMLRPGEAITLGDIAQPWTIRSVTIDGLSVEVEAEAAGVEAPLLPADPGRPVAESDEPIGRTELLLFEVPPSGDAISDGPIAYVAAASSGGWKPVPVELRLGAEPLPSVAMRRQAVMGRALSVLEPRVPMLMDELSSVTVELFRQSPMLFNADDDALMAGANLALIGNELIQFGRAEEVSQRTFRLTRLLRGRRGTEWASLEHGAGEPFCLIDQGILPMELGAGALGASMTAVAHGVGDTAPLPQAGRFLTGEAMRPPSPCHLRLRRETSAISAEWTRRSHRGWAWLDEVGVPDDPFAELYRVSIAGPSGEVSIEVPAPGFECALADLRAASGDLIQVTVATVGPRAISHGISATLTL